MKYRIGRVAVHVSGTYYHRGYVCRMHGAGLLLAKSGYRIVQSIEPVNLGKVERVKRVTDFDGNCLLLSDHHHIPQIMATPTVRRTEQSRVDKRTTPGPDAAWEQRMSSSVRVPLPLPRADS
jgi:hypothetical protein